ncbi:MAG TPA: DUF4139 domain-containing protein [Capsulimonadaceae bacterium]|jgi:hypothetical protein
MTRHNHPLLPALTPVLALSIALAPFASRVAADEPTRALTIYNQDFSVVRETVPLTLVAGENRVTFNDITYHVEPDSVVLRDAAGKRSLRILEQNYRADPISQELLLSLNEGKTIDFQVQKGDRSEIIRGKIIRSGAVPRYLINDYGGDYQQAQQSLWRSGGGQPIIEVDGKLQFTLPGLPIFPSLADDSILKPALIWTIASDKAGSFPAELSYITTGMTWKADYNVIAPHKGDVLDMTGWVTMQNSSGKTFENARIKLMAGDVSKIRNQQSTGSFSPYGNELAAGLPSVNAVSEKAFDDYHLYTLERPATLRDRETKQVEFARASGIQSRTVYVYDGAARLRSDVANNEYGLAHERNIAPNSTHKVLIMREIVNSTANSLGIPLPAGRMRFYRKDSDGQLEFIGENQIVHTPKDEKLSIYTGNAFDLVGDRRQTDVKLDSRDRIADETFEITLRNHKPETVEVRVVEHMYRGVTWSIPTHSDAFVKTDAQAVEFRVHIAPNETQTVTYTVHYTW